MGCQSVHSCVYRSMGLCLHLSFAQYHRNSDGFLICYKSFWSSFSVIEVLISMVLFFIRVPRSRRRGTLPRPEHRSCRGACSSLCAAAGGGAHPDPALIAPDSPTGRDEGKDARGKKKREGALTGGVEGWNYLFPFNLQNTDENLDGMAVMG